MKISEYIKNEREKMKGKSFRERLSYFWYYYKWLVIALAVVALVLAKAISTEINRKDVVLNGILVDGVATLETPAVLQEFYDTNGIDPEKEEIYLNTGLSLDSGIPSVVSTTYQRIHAGIGAKDTDFLMGYEYVIQRFANDPSNMFCDLRTILSRERLAELEEALYYIDGNVIEQIRENPDAAVPLPDPKKPEEMADPIPVAVDLSSCKEFVSAYYQSEKAVYFAVVVNAPRKELTAQFMEFLLS